MKKGRGEEKKERESKREKGRRMEVSVSSVSPFAHSSTKLTEGTPTRDGCSSPARLTSITGSDRNSFEKMITVFECK